MELPAAVLVASSGAFWSLLSVCCSCTCELEIEIFLHWIFRTCSPAPPWAVHLFMNKAAADDVSHLPERESWADASEQTMIHLSLLEQENQLVWCLDGSTNVTSFKRWGRRLWKNSPGTVQWTLVGWRSNYWFIAVIQQFFHSASTFHNLRRWVFFSSTTIPGKCQ